MYATILWATDGSRDADVALGEARRLLEANGHLIAFHCDQRFGGSRVGGIPFFADESDRIEQITRRVEELRSDGLDVDFVVERTTNGVGPAIAAEAKRSRADVIVCGTRSLGHLPDIFGGSSAAAVVKHASVPVVVVPLDAPRHADAASIEGAPI